MLGCSLCIAGPVHDLALQTTPASGGSAQTPELTVSRAHSSSIAITVRDIHGIAVPAAVTTLVGSNDTVKGNGTTDTKGSVTFTGLSAGTYRVKVDAAGLQPAVSPEIILGAGEVHTLAIIAMESATTKTTVNVEANLIQVAEAQVAEEEKQRVFGILPNYYVSYLWDAVAMTPKLKFKLAIHSAADPITFLVVAGVAGVEHAHKTFPGYEQGFEGYARRYGSAYADTAVSVMIGKALLPSIFHQDPRYFYRGSGSIRSRIWYALSASLICRGDDGRPEPNYSAVLGSFTAAGLSNLYRSPGDRGAGLTFRNGLIVVGSGAVVNVLREFVSRKATANVPAYANGKP